MWIMTGAILRTVIVDTVVLGRLTTNVVALVPTVDVLVETLQSLVLAGRPGASVVPVIVAG